MLMRVLRQVNKYLSFEIFSQKQKDLLYESGYKIYIHKNQLITNCLESVSQY